MRIAWVLNLDADEELRNPLGYAPTAEMQRRVAKYTTHLRDLARPGDVVLPAEPESLRGEFLGQAWCPTPHALARLERAGALRPRTPPLEVLRCVNHRAFAAALGQTLEGARYVVSRDELREHVSRQPARTWVLKRPYGFSGRGSRRVRFPNPDASDRRWIEATFRHEDGVQVEPWMERERDFGTHGYVDEAGSVRFGVPTVQECDDTGAWLGSRAALASDLTTREHDTLLEVAMRAAGALHDAGYFGPFGVDSYRWRGPGVQAHLNPCSELNARYTMGWAVGMGAWRPHGPTEGDEKR